MTSPLARLDLGSDPRRHSSYTSRGHSSRGFKRMSTQLVRSSITLPGVETSPRVPDFDFKKTPLWQFVVMAIGAVIIGDVDVKLMYAMIGQRNLGKGMLVSAVAAAFGNLVDMEKSANNPLGNDCNNDEAKKFM